MSEASSAIIGSIVGAYIFALLGCAGTAVWLLRLNPGPVAKAIGTAEDTAAGTSPLDIPGVPDPTSVMNSALTGQGGAAGLVGNALNNNPAAGLVGSDLTSKKESLSKIESLGNNLGQPIYKPDDYDDIDGIGGGDRDTIKWKTKKDYDFVNSNIPNTNSNSNSNEGKAWNTMKGGRKKTKTNRNPKLTNEPKVKQSIKKQKKPRTKKCLVTKGNQMYMSFCV